MINPQYEHSKFGLWMFNLCARWTIFLSKHRLLYYILAFTWGALMTILGLIITVILWILKLFVKSITFKKYHWIYYISVGPAYWGGIEIGLMFLRDHASRDSCINAHEFGHTFQNTLLGPLFIFLVAIPSAARYWIREIFPYANKTPYDSFWAEDAASQCGKYIDNYLNNKE